MGRGLAWEAKQRFPGIDKKLGEGLEELGNEVLVLFDNEEDGDWNNEEILPCLLSFPVKPVSSLNINDVLPKYIHTFKSPYPGFACKAQLDIIDKSCKQLRSLVSFCEFDKVVMPKVGCGNGELSWKEVEPIIEKYLNDIVIIVDRN